ncbi:MAG: NAD-dependent epimerase/dehydratase family protein [Mangrovibacterium sp.]
MNSNGISVILTGATGMVGEGVLLECLENPVVAEVLMVNRRNFDIVHPKLKELVVPDFMDLDAVKDRLAGYDACFYCAGISSVGMSKEEYTKITHDTTIRFAQTLKDLNPGLVFNFVSGAGTDSTGQSKMMWARVKGKTENTLIKLFSGRQYNFRPGLMKPAKGQQNFKGYNRYIKLLYPLMSIFVPSCSLREIARAMIQTTLKGYDKNILEVKDILKLAGKE